MVIAIGDLDFELHRPVHCRSINDACKGESAQCQKLSPALCIDRLSPQPAYDISDASIEYIEKEEEIKDEDIPVQKFCEIHVVSGYGSDAKEEEISPTRKSRRRRARINYDENDHVLDEIALVSTSTSLKKSVDVHIAKKSESRKESKTDAIKETKADDEIDSSVVELLDFEINDADVKEDDDEEEGDDAESIVFDMQFDELSCDDSEGEDLTFKKPKRTRGKIPKLKPKTIPCPDCKLMFRAERTLKSHRKRDHGFVQRNICTICGREFKDAGNLTQHMHTHGDSKRYICNFCGKGFHMPYNLKEHMHQHTGERPYKCSVCSKTFNRQTLRTAHMRVSNIHFTSFVSITDRVDAYRLFSLCRFTPAKNRSSASTRTATEPMPIRPI